MVTAPPMANPETFDAPMATTAKTSVATDVEGSDQSHSNEEQTPRR